MKVMVNGLLVNYEDEGSGKVVLLLHGWGADARTFTGLAHHLKERFRVIRLDFPGFGGSERPHEDWTVGEYASFMTDFLKKLEVESIFAVGAHSFGGRVTIKGVAHGAFTAEKIILMGAAGIKPRLTARQRLLRIVAKVGKAVTALPILSKLQPHLRRRLYSSAGTSDYLESGPMKQIFLNAINEDLQADATKLQQPTLLLWGEHDTSTPVADAKRYHELIKSSQLVILPGAGHFVYLDDPVPAYNAIDEFLS